ncbi:MAG: molybdopterin-dependent oxidoreductase [Algicola sp.]|nr:molybdopterin-dependent oxidoreductase [Algicola sp.]
MAITANSTWAAIKAKQMLDGSEHLKWTKSKYDAYDDDHLKKSLSELDDKNLRVVRSSGDTAAEIKRHSADSIHSAEYFNPYQENAQMEPLNAVAKYDGEHLTLWAGSQSPTQATDYVASVTGISLDKITIHSMRSGGGLGRRYFYDFIAEAAYLAIQTKKMVKLLWIREDCIQHGRYHLARCDNNTIALD